MLFVTIYTPSYLEAKNSIDTLGPEVDGIELRLDHFKTIDIRKIKELIQGWKKAIIFTLRKQSHGGHFSESEDLRQSMIEKLLKLEPDFIDLEWDTSVEFVKKINTHYPTVHILCSYHNFSETPQDLAQIFSTFFPAYAYKIAVTALSTADALRLMNFSKTLLCKDKKICAISMGEYGQITRILSPVMGNWINYASPREDLAAAPGQIDYATLCTTYRYKQLNTKTKIYGLIGDPITNSQSHILHNQKFSEMGLNCIYVKMRVDKANLSLFFDQVVTLPFYGLSVTMPLKELIELGRPINTLVRTKTGWHGYNTDGTGALNALEEKTPVFGKTILVIGTGGAGKAIISEAKKRGARLILSGRNQIEREKLAAQFGSIAIPLEEISKHPYDILIHATPVGMHSEEIVIDPSLIRPNSFVMDIVNTHTLLLKEAIKKHCVSISGSAMWEHQAAAQHKLWKEKDEG